MYQKFILFTVFFLIGFLINPIMVFAQTPEISPSPTLTTESANSFSTKSTPSSITLFRTQDKNSLSMEVSFALKEIPSNAIVDSTVLTYQQVGTSSGIIKIINRSNSEVIESLALGIEGEKTSNRLDNVVQKWINNSTNNNGLIFQNSELEIDNEIILNSINLTVNYTIPDTAKPEIIKFETQVVSQTVLRIIWETNEDSIVNVNYGKTSEYGQTTSISEEYSSKGVILIENLNPSISYHLQLVAEDKSKNKTESTNTIISTSNTSSGGTQNQSQGLLPPRILNLEVRTAGDKYVVDLAWSKSENTNLLGYIVFRNTKDEPYLEIARVSSNIVRFSDTKAEFGQEYSYYVVAYNASEQSSRSPVQETKIPDINILGINNIMERRNKPFAVFLIISGSLILFSVLYFIRKRIQTNINYNKKFKSHSRLHNHLHDPNYYMNNYEEKVIESR